MSEASKYFVGVLKICNKFLKKNLNYARNLKNFKLSKSYNIFRRFKIACPELLWKCRTFRKPFSTNVKQFNVM